MAIKEDQLAKLAALKYEMDPEGNHVYEEIVEPEFEDVFSATEELKIQDQFIREYKAQPDEEDEDLFYDGPEIEDKKVEIIYSGGVIRKYKNISEIELRVTDDQYGDIISAIKRFSQEKDTAARAKVISDIAQHGEVAVGVIFQKCRMFELVSETAKMQMAQLIAKLSHQDLDNRLLIKGILDYSTNESYLRLAIKAAGILNDQDMAKSLEKYLMQERYTVDAFKSLLKMRSTQSVSKILEAIEQIDSTNRVLVEELINVSKSFNVFGLETVEQTLDAYINCKNSVIRPIYILAIRSYGNQALSKLKEYSKKVQDDNQLFQIYKTIGGLRTEASSEVLKELLQQSDEKRKANVIAGISSTGDKQFIDIVYEELLQSNSNFYSSKCLQALSNIGGYNNESLRKKIEPFVKRTEGNVHVDAINCLVRLGDNRRFDDLMKIALNGIESERNIALKALSLLPVPLTERMVERLIGASDDDTFTIVTVLQKKNRLPRKTGEILLEKLKQPLPEFVKLEIYRLISRHEGLETRIVPDGFILKALEQEERISDMSRISRELRKMLKNKPEAVATFVGKS